MEHIARTTISVFVLIAAVVSICCYSLPSHAQTGVSSPSSSANEPKAVAPNKSSSISDSKTVQKVPDWVRRTVFNAELAVLIERYLNTHYAVGTEVGTATNSYPSFRGRIGFFTQLEREVGIGFRISTGSAHNSTYEALTGWGAKKSFNLDLAYFDYRPFRDLSLQAGKISNPFWFAGGNEMVFDSSVSFEGVQVKWKSGGASFRPWVVFSYYSLIDRLSTSSLPSDVGHGSDLALACAQLGISTGLGMFGVDMGLSVFSYNNIKGLDVAATGVADSPFFGVTASYNNSVTTVGGRDVFQNDYSILNAGVEVSLKSKLPISVFAEGNVNQRADLEKMGLIAGVSVGEITGRGSFFFQYSYRDVDQDAVFGMLADNFFLGGGPGVVGHRGILSIGVSKRATAGILMDFGRKLIAGEMRTFEVGSVEVRFVY